MKASHISVANRMSDSTVRVFLGLYMLQSFQFAIFDCMIGIMLCKSMPFLLECPMDDLTEIDSGTEELKAASLLLR